MIVEVSAPGKVILHGEHAVVYGKAAVAVSLNLRTKLKLVSGDDDKVILNLSNLKLKKEWNINALKEFSCSETAGDIVGPNEEIIKEIIDAFDLSSLPESKKLAVVAFLYLWTHISKTYNAGSLPSCEIGVDSQLVVGSGMGSSASYSVCLATVLLIVCGRITPRLLPEDKELINEWAFQAEKIFHGKPSGIDNSICTQGGAILFKDGEIAEVLPSLPKIKVLLVDTNQPRNTKALVTAVKEKQNLHPSVINHVMDAIHEISLECWKLLKDLHHSVDVERKLLLDLITMNHHLLNCLGVGGNGAFDILLDTAQSFDCTSKLTGAGGGGCGIVMLPFKDEDEATFLKSFKEAVHCYKFDIWSTDLGVPGVQVEFQRSP